MKLSDAVQFITTFMVIWIAVYVVRVYINANYGINPDFVGVPGGEMMVAFALAGAIVVLSFMVIGLIVFAPAYAVAWLLLRAALIVWSLVLMGLTVIISKCTGEYDYDRSIVMQMWQGLGDLCRQRIQIP